MGRALLALGVRWLVRLWIATLRCRRVGPAFEGPAVVAFFHGDQLPLLRIRPAPPVVAPVSLSSDGQLQRRVLAGFGIESVRGSSSRGGSRAARGLLRALRAGAMVLVAVDGPRGPRGGVKPGVAFLARVAGVPVYPVGVGVASGRRLRRAWDRFLLPCPFTRTTIVVGAPLTRRATETDTAFVERLADALAEATARARSGREGGAD